MIHDLGWNLGQTAPMIAGAALLIFAALHDIAARTIPNFVSVLLALIGLGLRTGNGEAGPALMLAAIVFVVCLACWLRGWMGGGDVKLLTASAVFVPPAMVGDMIVATMLAGGVIGLVYLVARTIARRSAAPRPVRRAAGPWPIAFVARVLRAERWRLLRGCPLPYASAIAAGVLFVTLSG